MPNVEMDQQIDGKHVSSQGGINFNDLKRRIHSGELEGSLIGMSGQKLSFSVVDSPERKILEVQDAETPHSNCYLTAMVQPLDMINLSVSTKYSPSRTDRHPDMFAGKFVDFAMNFFDGLGLRIGKFRGVWLEGYDNYASFMRDYESTGEKVLAAKNTWSGKVMARHGFTNIEGDDIEVYNEISKARAVRAIFYRPNPQI